MWSFSLTFSFRLCPFQAFPSSLVPAPLSSLFLPSGLVRMSLSANSSVGDNRKKLGELVIVVLRAVRPLSTLPSLPPPISSSPLIPSLLPSSALSPTQRHLTNVKLSKQDPYCTLTINTDKQRTAAIKKGGQHPEWDEQLKFDIYEDMQDQLLRASTSSNEDPDSLGRMSGKKEGKKVYDKGAKTMRLACYADAPREPELIGEAVFDLAKALNSGEDDGESRPPSVVTRAGREGLWTASDQGEREPRKASFEQ